MLQNGVSYEKKGRCYIKIAAYQRGGQPNAGRDVDKFIVSSNSIFFERTDHESF